MFPLPPLSFGFTGGTARSDNSGSAGGGTHVGGLNFGSQSGAFGGNMQTIVILGALALAVFFVARKL